MKGGAVFINAVMDVRIEQGVFHFVLGEMVPSFGGKTEFIPSFRGVIPEGNAAELFNFLRTKAEAASASGRSSPDQFKTPTECVSADQASSVGAGGKVRIAVSNFSGPQDDT